MPVMNVVRYPDDRLRQVSKPVKFDAETERFCESLTETMFLYDGAGLAAIQVGVPKHVFVLSTTEGPRIFANTEVISQSEDVESAFEGCLSLPGINAKVDRPTQVVVRSFNERGQEFQLTAGGFLARAVLHELDHCNGKLFVDHLSPLKRQMILKRFKKVNR